MTKIIWNVLKQSPALLGIVLMANAAVATTANTEKINKINLNYQENLTNNKLLAGGTNSFEIAQAINVPMDNAIDATAVDQSLVDPMGQVTSVSQLSDVDPTAWAFQALQSLVERYGCIAGYPDGTFKGNRAMTRYEFAAGLNACLDRITELIAASTADLITKEDLAVLQKLQEQFAAELAEIKGRTDALEARTAELEANQFSTTTKLNGEVLFWMSGIVGDSPNNGVLSSKNDEDDEINSEVTLGSRVRLNFDTSFTGYDLLRARLQVNNLTDYGQSDAGNTPEARLSAAGTSDPNNDVYLDKLYYKYPFGDKGSFFVGANASDFDDFAAVITPFNSDGDAAISRFGRRNPFTMRGPSNAAVAFGYNFSDSFKWNLAYTAGDPADAREGRGYFNGSYTAFTQFAYQPSDKLGFALEYSYKYFPKDRVNLTGGTGSKLAVDPFPGNVAAESNNVGLQMNWKISDGFQLGGWYGVSWASAKDGGVEDLTLMNGAITFAFPDLFSEGSLGGLILGVPPMIVDSDESDLEEDTPYHIEAFYRYQINDNISITPGFFVVINPNNNEDNDTIWVGTLRTQFKF
ncbi:MAG: iron uptake porin [Microcoleaceae cyanobacterium]